YFVFTNRFDYQCNGNRRSKQIRSCLSLRSQRQTVNRFDRRYRFGLYGIASFGKRKTSVFGQSKQSTRFGYVQLYHRKTAKTRSSNRYQNIAKRFKRKTSSYD